MIKNKLSFVLYREATGSNNVHMTPIPDHLQHCNSSTQHWIVFRLVYDTVIHAPRLARLARQVQVKAPTVHARGCGVARPQLTPC